MSYRADMMGLPESLEELRRIHQLSERTAGLSRKVEALSAAADSVADRAGISGRVRTFLQENIASVEELEILLLLASDPQRSWSEEELFARLQSSASSIQQRVGNLFHRKLIEPERGSEGRYTASTGADAFRDGTVSELAETYSERRVSVVELIYNRTPEAIQEFARAFRIRK